MAQKSRAEYFRERRKKLKERNKTKTQWLLEKINEEK